jgi:hypothetical protein
MAAESQLGHTITWKEKTGLITPLHAHPASRP